MDARTAQAIAKAACDRQRLLHASNRLRAAERRRQRELEKLLRNLRK